MILLEWLVSGHHETNKWVAGIENNLETENHFPYNITVSHHESWKKYDCRELLMDIYYQKKILRSDL